MDIGLRLLVGDSQPVVGASQPVVGSSQPVVGSSQFHEFGLRLLLGNSKLLDSGFGPLLGNGEAFLGGGQIGDHRAELGEVAAGDEVVVGVHDEFRQQFGLLFIKADQKAIFHFDKVTHRRPPLAEAAEGILADGKRAGKRQWGHRRKSERMYTLCGRGCQIARRGDTFSSCQRHANEVAGGIADRRC